MSCVNQEYDNFHAFILDDSTEEDYKNRINEFSAKYLEIVFAVVFFIISLLSRNIWFLSFSSGLAISIVLLRFGFENRVVRYLAGVPLAILIMIIILIGKTLQ